MRLRLFFRIIHFRVFNDISAFEGQPFGSFLRNMGAPDQMLTIGSITLNVLPILMTIINIISSEIYTKGAPLKDKLMLHGIMSISLFTGQISG